jgi:hypothetical protein
MQGNLFDSPVEKRRYHNVKELEENLGKTYHYHFFEGMTIGIVRKNKRGRFIGQSMGKEFRLDQAKIEIQ